MLFLGSVEDLSLLIVASRVSISFQLKVAPAGPAGSLDVQELEEAGVQFDAQLAEVLAQNRKVANYVKKLEAKDREAAEASDEPATELPSAQDLVAEIERFLRQQPPGDPGRE